MKPEHRSDDLFDKGPEPVTSRDVYELVTEDGALDVERKAAQSRRQQHDWTPNPERHGLRQPIMPSQLCMRCQRALKSRDVLIECRLLATPAQPSEANESDRQPRAAAGSTEEHGPWQPLDRDGRECGYLRRGTSSACDDF